MGMNDMRESQTLRPMELFKRMTPLAQRPIQPTLTIQPKQIECDELDWHFIAQKQIMFATAETFLKIGERKHCIAAHRENFAVESHVVRKVSRGIAYVAKCVGHVLQVSRVERHARTD